jgi:hypothetical protein
MKLLDGFRHGHETKMMAIEAGIDRSSGDEAAGGN